MSDTPNADKLIRSVLEKVSAQRHKISCPYCEDGYAIIVLSKLNNNEVQLEGGPQPRKCERCGKYMGLHMQFKVVAVPLKEERPHGS